MCRAVTTSACRGVLAGCILLAVTAPGFAADVSYLPGDYPWEPAQSYLAIDPNRLLPKFSTLGKGVEYRYYSSVRFGVRLESFEYRDGRDGVNDALQTQWRIKLHTNSLLFDWLPFEGRFRATTGIYVNRSELNGSAHYADLDFSGATVSAQQLNGLAQEAARQLRQSGYREYAPRLEQFASTNTQSLTINGRTVDLRDVALVSARVRLPPYAPYLGIGWRNVDGKGVGLSYSIDMGFMHLGRPRVEYSVTGSLVDAARSYYGSALDERIAEEERQAEESLSKYRYYPVVSVGLAYRF
jgi:hypothetical protein